MTRQKPSFWEQFDIRLGALEILMQNLYAKYLMDHHQNPKLQAERSLKRAQDKAYLMFDASGKSNPHEEKIQNQLIDFFGHISSMVATFEAHRKDWDIIVAELNINELNKWLDERLPSQYGRSIEAIDPVEALASDQVVRLWLNYERPNSTEPLSIILKRRGENPVRNQMVDSYKLFDREIFFYNSLSNDSPVKSPKCYVNSTQEQYLLLQDFGQFVTGDQDAGYFYDEAVSVIDEMARFHAHWMPSANKFKPLIPSVNTPEMIEGIQVMLDQAWDVCGETLCEIADVDAHGIIRDLKKQIPETANALAESPGTLLHGDLRMENLLFEDMSVKTIIDWQLLTYGSPMVDIAYFLTQSGDAEPLEKAEIYAFDRYANSLADYGYTKAKLMKEYKLATRYNLIIPIFGAAWDLQTQSQPRSVVSASFKRALVAMDAHKAL